MIEVKNNIRIEFNVVAITSILYRLLAESYGCFCQQAEFENVANTEFENLKHLQNPGHLSLTEPSMPTSTSLAQARFIVAWKNYLKLSGMKTMNIFPARFI